MFWKQPFSDKIPPKVREEKGEVDSMTARCVVRLLQMRIAGACPSPPGHTRDILWLSVARATCTRTLYDPFHWPFGRAPRTKGDLQQLKAF